MLRLFGVFTGVADEKQSIQVKTLYTAEYTHKSVPGKWDI